jgi:hypothetical protein
MKKCILIPLVGIFLMLTFSSCGTRGTEDLNTAVDKADGIDMARYQFKQGCFSCTVAAKQAIDFVFFQLQRYMVERCRPLIAFCNIFKSNHYFSSL